LLRISQGKLHYGAGESIELDEFICPQITQIFTNLVHELQSTDYTD